ncbi:uncharacterized protein LOC129957456 [Argiope bruennichi]|uniref:uncharacterized protein LOC129957456 n=1 Tax=Argiope bruennichi TaxID=94029 RepID=UPI002493D257|nr:uncharacterized protein LOC129957456 [Argiope bruennichi]
MFLLYRVFGETVASLFEPLEDFEQHLPRTDEDDSEQDESFETPNLIHRHGIYRDMESGRRNADGTSKSSAENKISKHRPYILFTTTCGFLAAAFAFTSGLMLRIQCPGKGLLEYIFMSMGALGSIALLYILSLLLPKEFRRFRSHHQAIICLASIFFLGQWLFGILVYYFEDSIDDSFKDYCNPSLYKYTIYSGPIVILAFIILVMLSF